MGDARAVFFQQDGEVIELPAPAKVTFEPEPRSYSCAPAAASIPVKLHAVHVPWRMKILLFQGRPAFVRWLNVRAQMRRKGRPGWRHWRGYGRG